MKVLLPDTLGMILVKLLKISEDKVRTTLYICCMTTVNVSTDIYVCKDVYHLYKRLFDVRLSYYLCDMPYSYFWYIYMPHSYRYVDVSTSWVDEVP